MDAGDCTSQMKVLLTYIPDELVGYPPFHGVQMRMIPSCPSLECFISSQAWFPFLRGLAALAVLIFLDKVTLLGISKQPGGQCWPDDGVNLFTKGQNHPSSEFKLRVESRGLGDGPAGTVFTLTA